MGSEWISQLKAGDTAIVVRHFGVWGGRSRTEVKVTKVADGLVGVGEHVFRGSDGRCVNGPLTLAEPTCEVLREVRAAKYRDGLLHMLAHVRYCELSTDKLERIKAVIDE